MILIAALVGIAISAAINIWCEYGGIRRGVYFFKPLTTTLIITLAVFSGEPISVSYKTLIVMGLVFSLAGDVFLMLPTDQFIAGLGSFLVAHIFYIVAFGTESEGTILWLPLLPLVAYGIIMMAILWPYLGSTKGPVIAYMIVILMMAWLALSRWQGSDQDGVELAGIGATLFVISDSLLAVNRFRKSFAPMRLMVLSTYFTAQTFIALSIQAS